MQRFLLMAAAMLLFATGSAGVVDDAHAQAIVAALPQADWIIVKKSAHTLTLVRQGQVIKTFTVALGREPGPKEKIGDSRTPEGTYRIDWRNPHSKFHLALHISYPSPQDKLRAERGSYAPGGAIMIHGRPNWTGWIRAFFQDRDWTDGCIAVSNADMDQIWQAVPDGTPITILP